MLLKYYKNDATSDGNVRFFRSVATGKNWRNWRGVTSSFAVWTNFEMQESQELCRGNLLQCQLVTGSSDCGKILVGSSYLQIIVRTSIN